ncbi:NUDIX hydrolase [Motilibacter aurantiacus]|uniref:hypothetical protein n=1 Tax=Motilibacter aurantiacus TaxID=2714955 RepID=UPI00140A6C73|nr:hypothetical protein [Motilibacter aurantiacus]NHC45747.1 hypothetical protein [Motilibacter aurantiacus]
MRRDVVRMGQTGATYDVVEQPGGVAVVPLGATGSVCGITIAGLLTPTSRLPGVIPVWMGRQGCA